GGFGIGQEVRYFGIVVVVVILRVGVHVDVTRFGVADDRHVVVAAREDAVDPGGPLDDGQFGGDADFGELLGDHFTRAALDVVRLGQFELHGETVRVAGFLEEFLRAFRVVRVRVGQVDEVRLGGAHVAADDRAKAEEGAVDDGVLVDRVGHGLPD